MGGGDADERWSGGRGPQRAVEEGGLAEPTAIALSEQRALVESLGGSFHQVVAEQVPTALVEFARGVNATQLVVG